MDEGLPYTGWGRGFYMHYGLPHDAIPGARERARDILGALPEYLKANPRVKFAQPTPPGNSAYEQSWPKRGSRPVINLGDIATILLDDRSKRARDQGTQILIHEAIHANQPESVLRKINFREGQAELLSRKVAQEQYGIETPKSTYQPLVNQLQRRYGSNSGRILREIFTRGG